MLNPQSPLPLYHQLAEILLAEIRAGSYPVGTRIPSEHQLAARYRIGRPTVRQATDLLVRRKILVRRRGSGTFVQQVSDEIDLFSLAGTSASFLQQGVTVATRILRPLRLRKVAPAAHNPFSGGKAFCFARLSVTPEAPVLIEEFWLDPRRFAGIDAIDLEGQSLARIVAEHFFMRPEGGRQTFRIDTLDAFKARHLGVERDTPILAVRRYLQFPQAPDAIYSELLCRTDRFVFAQTLGGINNE